MHPRTPCHRNQNLRRTVEKADSDLCHLRRSLEWQPRDTDNEGAHLNISHKLIKEKCVERTLEKVVEDQKTTIWQKIWDHSSVVVYHNFECVMHEHTCSANRRVHT